LSFHWGWFLRYKLSQPQHRHPSWVPHRPSPTRPPATPRSPPFGRARRHLVPPAPPRAQFARRPLRDIQHTHYHPQIVVWFVSLPLLLLSLSLSLPLSLPLSLSLSLSPSVCYGVSRASYIFSGCITLHPRPSPSSQLSPRCRPRRPNRTGHLLPRCSRGPGSHRARTKLSPGAAH